MTSKWNPFRAKLPTSSTELGVDISRRNLFAQSALANVGIEPGWSYTNSFTRGQASPGTAAAPAREFYKKGSGNSTIWVQSAITWTGGVATKVALYFSEDNETSYVPMTDEDGINYVLTLVYDGSNNLMSTSWGNVP